jgi:hypothetical protein
MPLVLLGIPWLSAAIAALFSGLIAFFVQFFTKRFALGAAFIAATVICFVIFFGVIFGLMQAISYSAPPEVSMAFRCFVPDNFAACMGAILTAKTARWLYDWNMHFVQFQLSL